MTDNRITDFIKAKGPVPKLSVLLPAELVAILTHHYQTCGFDHASLAHQAPEVSTIDFEDETFRCTICEVTQHFDVPANLSISVDEYICRILRQGVRFNMNHFVSCAQAKGGQQ